MVYSTASFTHELKMKYGTKYQKSRKKLTFVMAIFSVAFLIRGSFDFYVFFAKP